MTQQKITFTYAFDYSKTDFRVDRRYQASPITSPHFDEDGTLISITFHDIPPGHFFEICLSHCRKIQETINKNKSLYDNSDLPIQEMRTFGLLEIAE
jgi:hypothetical protein